MFSYKLSFIHLLNSVLAEYVIKQMKYMYIYMYF